jgi:hypothetical protein
LNLQGKMQNAPLGISTAHRTIGSALEEAVVA